MDNCFLAWEMHHHGITLHECDAEGSVQLGHQPEGVSLGVGLSEGAQSTDTNNCEESGDLCSQSS